MAGPGPKAKKSAAEELLDRHNRAQKEKPGFIERLFNMKKDADKATDEEEKRKKDEEDKKKGGAAKTLGVRG